jgi:hypothetical protein
MEEFARLITPLPPVRTQAWREADFKLGLRTSEPVGFLVVYAYASILEVRPTRRWREPDSNHRSRSCERLFCALPIGNGGTKGGATYRFRSETAMLAWSGCP